MMRNKFISVTMLLTVTACNHSMDGRAAWNDVLKNCAFSDLNSDKILYFGPSNSVGPGSVWRNAADGSFRIRWTLKHMPNHENFTEPGETFQCAGTKLSASNLSVSLGFAADPAPVSAELQTDLSKALSVEVEPTAVAWAVVVEGPYEEYIDGLSPDTGPRPDLEKGNRLVMYRALRVEGYSVKIVFNSKDVVGLKSKYVGTIPSKLMGNADFGLTASWSDSGTLTLRSSEDKIYIAGEIVPYNPTGFAGSSASLSNRVVTVGENPVIAREMPQ